MTEQDKQDIANLVDAPVDDVQINGTSIVSNGVANVPLASDNTAGVIKTSSSNSGLMMLGGALYINPALSTEIKSGVNLRKPIAPKSQHESTFYGLAKAAGHDEKNSSLPVGTYTPEAKASIKSMLGVQDGLVVNATLVSGTQYTIDSTYDDIKTALSAGKTVVVMTGGVPQPYVGNVQLYDEWYLAFGVSTIYDNIATLTGFMIPQTYQNVAIWTAQNTTIPTLSDVQINGTSIVTDGVANVPVASANDFGAVKVGTYGVKIQNGFLYISDAGGNDMKNGTNVYGVITSFLLDKAVFYGLARASGDVTQKATTYGVMNYTEDAKSKISEMLGGSVSVSGTTPTIVAKSGIRYVCGEVATLDLTPSATGICDVVFTSGSTPTVVTLPSTVKFPDGAFTAEADTTYEINILDGIYGAVMSWT